MHENHPRLLSELVRSHREELLRIARGHGRPSRRSVRARSRSRAA